MSLEPGKAPIVAGIGLACLLGASLLAWLSSPATLQLTRDNENYATAALESRLFGLIVITSERVERIKSVSTIGSGVGGTRSDNADRLTFLTVKGPVDLGRNQQLFAPDYQEVAGFFGADAPPSLTLSSVARGAELRRFFIAQAIALFMFLGGLGLEWTVIRHLMS